jgi:hypothetical protein
MNKEWNKEPDENGDITLIIRNDAGAAVSTWKGKTMEEIADKVAESNMQATKEIARLRKPDAGRPSKTTEPRKLTADDNFRLASEITDPNKVVSAVTEIITATTGVSPEEQARERKEREERELTEYYVAEAKAFAFSNFDYYPVQQNSNALAEELKANGWPWTRNNLQLAFETLVERGDVVLWPSEDEKQKYIMQVQQQQRPQQRATPNGSDAQPTTPEPNPPTTRPRSISTVIRSSDASASAPPPPKKAQLTRADIERMPRAEYMEKLHDPAFRKAVDALGA